MIDDVELLHDVHERVQPMDVINMIKAVEDMGGSVNIMPSSQSDLNVATLENRFVAIYFEIILPITVSVLVQRNISHQMPQSYPLASAV